MQPLLRTTRGDVSARKTYDLLDEPTGPDYAGLLECALVQCTTAVLTVPSTEMDPEGQATVESLKAELMSTLIDQLTKAIDSLLLAAFQIEKTLDHECVIVGEALNIAAATAIVAIQNLARRIE